MHTNMKLWTWAFKIVLKFYSKYQYTYKGIKKQLQKLLSTHTHTHTNTHSLTHPFAFELLFVEWWILDIKFHWLLIICYLNVMRTYTKLIHISHTCIFIGFICVQIAFVIIELDHFVWDFLNVVIATNQCNCYWIYISYIFSNY